MEVQLDKRYALEVDAARAWAILGDVRAVAACMPGAAITEQIDATHYKGTVKSKVGPATMAFAGDIEVLAVDAAARTMEMLGKGSDRGGSSASMKLLARIEAGETAATSVLVGQANVIVSGKLAQFGSRLLVPVSDAMLAQFAANFQTAAAAVVRQEDLVLGETTAIRMVLGSQAPGALPTGEPVRTVVTQPQVKELNALALMWIVIKNWFAGLFGRKKG